MKSSHVMCTSKILIDSGFTKQRIKIKNNFVDLVYIDAVYSVSAVKMC